MEMKSVDSSMIVAIGYEKEKELLTVQFNNDSVYEYSPVPERLHKSLITASSIGKYFNEHIRDQYAVE